MNDFSDAQDLQPKYKGDENKLEYVLGNEDSIDNKHSSKNVIYDAVRVYTSDCAGLGKSYLIKKEIIEEEMTIFILELEMMSQKMIYI